MMINQAEQARLITQVMVNNNHHAFESLIKIHQSQIRNYARRLTKGDFALADDIAQETFITAFEKIGGYGGKGSFIGWLLKICYRLFLQHLRKQHLSVSDEEPAIAVTDNTEPELMLQQAFNQISHEQSSAITLNASFGYTHDEIAEIMALPVGTVKSHITRGKSKLKQILTHQQRGAA